MDKALTFHAGGPGLVPLVGNIIVNCNYQMKYISGKR